MQSERFRLGSRVLGTDGDCGELVRVVIDPVAQALTHLVVKPRHHRGVDKLVSIELVESSDEDHVRLHCTVAQFESLDDAEDVQFLPGDTDDLGYGDHAVLWPYYSVATPARKEHHAPIYTDRIPLGDVEVKRGDEVHAKDGWIGSVQGLVIDPADRHVTHILLQEGHLWGRKRVAIPVGTVSRVGDEIRVDLSKQQVEELPPIELR
jgi:sporulation protein YlmC with PRC-barrel domain